MDTYLVDGKAISQEILATVKKSVTRSYIVRAITVAPNAATQSYLRIKSRAAEAAGMTLEVVELPEVTMIDAVISAVQAPGADAVIVQLPLPKHLDEDYILNAIPEGSDADVLSSLAREAGTFVPPVAGAVDEILARAGINPEGKKVVVVGKGRLVGAPVAKRLQEQGAIIRTYDEDDFSPVVLKDADIVVSGAGIPGLIQPHMLKEGVALIDAGTSEQGGVIKGDIDPACAQQAILYTPVPGGIGPITVACLLRNVAQLQNPDLAVL